MMLRPGIFFQCIIVSNDLHTALSSLLLVPPRKVAGNHHEGGKHDEQQGRAHEQGIILHLQDRVQQRVQCHEQYAYPYTFLIIPQGETDIARHHQYNASRRRKVGCQKGQMLGQRQQDQIEHHHRQPHAPQDPFQTQ